MNRIRSKLNLARASNAQNYNIVTINDYDNKNALFLLEQEWQEGLFGEVPWVGSYSPFDAGMTNENKINYIESEAAGGQIWEDIVTLEHPEPKTKKKVKKDKKWVDVIENWKWKDGDGPKLSIAQRLYCSRMWYYGEEVHSYVGNSIKIQQGNKTGNYSDGNLLFKLRAYTVNGKKKNFTWGHNLKRVGSWERDYSIKNVTAIWSSACFGKNTIIKLSNNKEKQIWKIKPGDILENDIKVTGIMKCKVGSNEIFNLDNILVTGTHKLLYNGEFISTCEHPNAIKDENYTEDYVYCLNTESKTIEVNNHVFTDWDELNETDIIKLKANLANEFERENESRHNNNIGKTIHKYIDSGLHPYTTINVENGICKYLKNIKCGDILDNGSKVTAVIKIDATNIPIYKHTINDTSIFGTQNLVYYNDNTIKTTYYNEKERKLYQPEKSESIKYLYHLLTDKEEFNINKTTFACYNKNLEIFL